MVSQRKCFFTILIASLIFTTSTFAENEFHRIPVEEYMSKMKAGWIGQMAGVGWGGPTEFRWRGEIIPEDEMPEWEPEMINQFHQDDIYVEMTFLRSLELHGLDVSIRQAGIDFANSEYPLWHANRAGRSNLRNGIAPPDSGHPEFNNHADDIDYQIEADFSGLIAPGMPNTVIRLGEIFGRLMNYGDGLYGGQFVGGMYAEAFFNDDLMEIVEAGLRCIPEESLYAQTIRDVIRWYQEEPEDWVATWEKIEAKYQDNPDNRRFSCSGAESDFNIDAKINGAYIVMGLLYGKGDPDQTILISTRCGQDSDCNPSNAAGILFTTMGFENLPERFVSELDESNYFSHTAYNFPKLIDVCESLTRQAIIRNGGRVETKDEGKEEFVIPVQKPEIRELVQCWEAKPIAHSIYTEEEMSRIYHKPLRKEMESFAPGWKVQHNGDAMPTGVMEHRGKENILVTHPQSLEQPCIISKSVDIPEDKKTFLRLIVSHHEQGDWLLRVKVDDEELLHEIIGEETLDYDWKEFLLEISSYAGDHVNVEIYNEANDWKYEAGYWSKIELVTQ